MKKINVICAVFLINFYAFLCSANIVDWKIDKKDLHWFAKSIGAIEDGKIEDAKRYSKKLKDKDVIRLVENCKYSYNKKRKTYDVELLSSIKNNNINKILDLPNLIGKDYVNFVSGVDDFIHNSSLLKDKNFYTKKLIINTWIKSNFSKQQESKFFERHFMHIRKSDHIDRANHMVSIGNYSSALRMKKYLPSYYKPVIEARVALRSGKNNAMIYLEKVPKSLRNDPCLMYDIIFYKKNKGQHNGNVEKLLDISRYYNNKEQFWGLKRYYARELVYKNSNKLKNRNIEECIMAYKLASSHGLKSGVDFFDAEWLSGWIAFRFLNDYQRAEKHFKNLRQHVKTPISVSRASYWLARSYEKIGKNGMANFFYEEAMKYPHTFYGQLAVLKKNANLFIDSTIRYEFKDSDYKNYYKNIFNKYVYVAAKSKQKRLAFALAPLAVDAAKSNGEILIGIKKVLLQYDKSAALSAARRADGVGLFVPEAMYPYINTKNNCIDNAIRMAIIRQESGFDKNALSSAGAFGLMQLMPKTAEEVAVKSGIVYNKKSLADPEYNINLGSLYLSDLLDKNNYSLILALSSYNAGPGNAKKWADHLGDISKLSIDERVDWIESIPFNETRNYVQRVIENIQVYRHITGPKSKKSSISIKLADDIR